MNEFSLLQFFVLYYKFTTNFIFSPILGDDWRWCEKESKCDCRWLAMITDSNPFDIGSFIMRKNVKEKSEKVSRIKTKQPGVYKNESTGKYDVKYCYSVYFLFDTLK